MRIATAGPTRSSAQEVSYALDPQSGAFVIEGYNWAKPFSSFFPGIAGKWGVPLWAYYVSRGQAVVSVGVGDKDGQILEFQSFNHAMARVAKEGFRTFLRLDGGPVYEPFSRTDLPGIEQTMVVCAGELLLRERNLALELELEVAYFPLPGLPLAALAREVRVRSLAHRSRQLEWLDGAARVLPYGLDQKQIKFVARHVEAMMGASQLHGAQLFRLKQSAADSERVEEVGGGNFYLPVSPRKADRVIVDPEALFGEGMDYDRPWRFEQGGLSGLLATVQYRDNKTPCAFSARKDRLPAGGEVRHASLLGYVPRDEDLAPLVEALAAPGFLAQKRAENSRTLQEISDHAFTVSSSPSFDAYAGQTFLDNVVRGGMPLMLQTREGPSAFYLYSRQNGDLERDYHQFVLEPTWLSQGTGHYRSVLQNRRTDSWFFPEVGEANLVTFLNLLQLDGYNPLEVLGQSYRVEDEPGLERWLSRRLKVGARRELLAWMQKGFTPGALLMRLEREVPGQDREKALQAVLAHCSENEQGALHEGFWVDHWHYNFDLLETYLMVWPDRLRELLLGRCAYTFFDNPDVVLPRALRSVEVAPGKVRSYGAVGRDLEKEQRISARSFDRHKVRTRRGKGSVYRTRLLVKLLGVVANRLCTLDPAGRGVEMEASKPGWNDSMNGLPGLFGSGLSETLELQRAIRFLLDALERLAPAKEEVLLVYEELASLIGGLQRVIKARLRRPDPGGALRYWEQANDLKERYREQTRLGVWGKERKLRLSELRRFLLLGEALLDQIFSGQERQAVVSAQGVPYTYFVNEVVRSRPLGTCDAQGHPRVRPLAFAPRPVKLFLEGPVHWMKARPAEAKQVYQAVRASELFDRKLKMYKSCESMEGESPELGRAVGAYPRGWIENESIYLHMEYKYLLEVLRSGQCEAFWEDARHALVPFMDPVVYGRSTLEGASFIVSSAYADPSRHGQAFQPRLSGITCEFLHIWIIAAAGEYPFRLDANEGLELALEPRLPGWLFTEGSTSRRYHDPVDGWLEVEVPDAAFGFKLMNRALVVYQNPSRRHTFGPDGAVPTRSVLQYRDGKQVTVEGRRVPSPHAQAVRLGKVRRIDVTLE